MTKKLLFLCIGNCCRSQMAEGFARHYLGEGRGEDGIGEQVKVLVDGL